MRNELCDQIVAETERAKERSDALLRFPISRIGEIEIHPLDWLIERFAELGTQVAIVGESGAGKTHVAIDMGLSTAAGVDWHGRKVLSGAVLYICGEGRSGVLRRCRGWGIARHVDISKIPFYITAGAVCLTDQTTMVTVQASLESITQESPPLRLIILDTWATNLGGDENSTPDAAAGIQALQTLAAPYGAAVLIVHHVGHGDKSRARGSSAFRASLDMEYLVERGEDEIIRVVNTKSKDCEPPPPLAFTLTRVPLGLQDTNGEEISSVVLTACDYEPSKPPKEATGKNQVAALEVLRGLYSRYRANLEHAGNNPAEARVAELDWKSAALESGIQRTRYYEARKSLIQMGVVKQEGSYVYLL